MQLHIDPKPVGAFVEYTLKPLVDDIHELLERLGQSDVDLKDIMKGAFRLYVFDRVMAFITSLSVTLLICATILIVLRFQA